METQQFTETGKIKEVWYRNTSYVGKNSYYIAFETESGNIMIGYTAPNASCGYSCKNYELKEFAYIEYHYTKSGKMVIYVISNRSTYEKYHNTDNK